MSEGVLCRCSLRLFGLSVLLGLSRLAALEATASTTESAARPNFLIILVDDMGYSDPGFMGGEIETPNLDRLAREGLTMTQAMNGAVCSPTRAALMTGCYPNRVGYPSLAGALNPAYPVLPELLKAAGYRSFISGKWHLHQNNCSPTGRGFEAFFGLPYGADSHWGGCWQDPQTPGTPTYSSDAIATHAVEFLQQAAMGGTPWLLYLAFTAPHYPLHAPRQLIDRYAARYRAGWDRVREARWERQRQLGLFPDTARLSYERLDFDDDYRAGRASVDRQLPAWDTLAEPQQDRLVRLMAIYAAMVHQVDVNIGRVLEQLERSGQLDNTVVFFASDNGACGSQSVLGSTTAEQRLLSGFDPQAPLGAPGSNPAYGSGWAHVSNTPLRRCKWYAHAGGNTTSLIIRGALTAGRSGQRDPTACHLMDLVPTCLDLAGLPPPATGLDGISLLPACRGEALPERTLYFAVGINELAVVRAQWRLVKPGRGAWECYDRLSDPTETQDLAAQMKELVASLSAQHAAWLQQMRR
jgi:arylsulfatase